MVTSRCFCSLDHPVLHKAAIERSMHTLEAHNFSQDFVPYSRAGLLRESLANDKPRSPNPDPNGVSPTRNRRFCPVLGRDGCHCSSSGHNSAIFLVGDEERMRPLVVQELEALLVMRRKVRWSISLAPRRNGQATAGFQNAYHFSYVGFLVWHVLATFTGPDQIKAIWFKRHCQGVHDDEFYIFNALLLGQLLGPPGLLLRQCDPRDLSLWESPRENTRSPANTASDIQDLLNIQIVIVLDLRPSQHFVHKVVLCLLEVLLLIPAFHLTFSIVPEVHVLAPVVL
mmetsp:Transcript_16712/g.41108  ORF Transcript_16712/g.41108 Transcript_16712/m.41108 type:complete len:284 (-) Transcript_16712:435-1286(-)